MQRSEMKALVGCLGASPLAFRLVAYEPWRAVCSGSPSLQITSRRSALWSACSQVRPLAFRWVKGGP